MNISMQYPYTILTICQQDALATNRNGVPFLHQWQWGAPPTNISIISKIIVSSLYYLDIILILYLHYAYKIIIISV